MLHLFLLLLSAELVASIRFGVSQTLTAYDSSQTDRAELGRRIADGIDYWYQLHGRDLGFDYLLYDDQGNTSLLIANYRRLLADSSVDFLLGPQGSDFSMIVKSMMDNAGRLFLGTSVGSDSFYQGRWCFSVLTTASRALASVLPPLRFKGASTVAYLTEKHPFTSGACYSLPNLAKNLGINTLGGFNLSFYAAGTLTSEQEREMEQALQALRNLNADILVLGMFPPSGAYAVEVLHRMSYMPKAVVIAPMLQNWEDNPLAEYLQGVEEWLPNVAYPADSWYGDSQEYTRDFTARYGYQPSSYNVMGSIAALIMQEAVRAAANSTNSTSQENVRFALSRTALNLFWGPMSYATTNSCLKDTVVFQMINGTRIPVAPVATQLRDLIYPIPTWDERVEDIRWFQYSSEIGVAVLSAFGILLSLAFAVFIIVYRQHPVVRPGTPPFTLAMLVGSIILYVSLFLWMLYADDATCATLPWLLSIGFTICLGSLTLKSYRLIAIWKGRERCSIVTIPNSRLWLILGVMVGIDIVFLSLWTGIDPVKAMTIVPDPLRPIHNYRECSVGSSVPLWLLLAFQLTLLLYSCWIGFELRKVDLVVYSESLLPFCSWNFLAYGAIIFGLQASQAVERETLFIVRSMLLWLLILTTTLAIMVPRIYFLIYDYDTSTKTVGLEMLKINTLLASLKELIEAIKNKAPLDTTKYERVIQENTNLQGRKRTTNSRGYSTSNSSGADERSTASTTIPM